MILGVNKSNIRRRPLVLNIRLPFTRLSLSGQVINVTYRNYLNNRPGKTLPGGRNRVVSAWPNDQITSTASCQAEYLEDQHQPEWARGQWADESIVVQPASWLLTCDCRSGLPSSWLHERDVRRATLLRVVDIRPRNLQYESAPA